MLTQCSKCSLTFDTEHQEASCPHAFRVKPDVVSDDVSVESADILLHAMQKKEE